MITIVLVEPENPKNIGAAARAMKNFGFFRLILVNPKCSYLGDEAKKVSKHAFDILKKAKAEKRIPADFDCIIATTSRFGGEKNIIRAPITLEEASERIRKNSKSNIAILFGREGSGLTNSEIRKCDFAITIPTYEKYPVMNLSHSVAVVLYEISKAGLSRRVKKRIPDAKKEEKKALLSEIGKAIKILPFSDARKRETQKIVWKRVIGKSMLSKSEAYALFGFFRKIKEKTDKLKKQR
ncbi:MAG: RNA methyltransferase [Candidatus Woesearchaeota archaeon]|nr:RNA methyltransferase [Candidatus Woesearchaeota archaeon]